MTEARWEDLGDEEMLIAAPTRLDEEDAIEAADDRRFRMRRAAVRDALARRMLEAFICFQLETCPPFRTRFERLKVEVDETVVYELLFDDPLDLEKAQVRLNNLQRRIGVPKSARITLRDAVADALPSWRRGGVARNERRRQRIAPFACDALDLLGALSPEERALRFALFASCRVSRELARDGAIRADELERCSPRLARDGIPTLLGLETVEEVRYLVLRRLADTPALLPNKGLEAA